jgi:hypothetical protein
MSFCSEKSIKLGKLCISIDDYLIILMNVITIITVFLIFMIRDMYYKSNKMSVLLKNNFTALGEEPLKAFYTTTTIQQKVTGPKKKVTMKSASQANQNEKLINNELKCVNCNRKVEVSYQYTMHKLSSS